MKINPKCPDCKTNRRVIDTGKHGEPNIILGMLWKYDNLFLCKICNVKFSGRQIKQAFALDKEEG